VSTDNQRTSGIRVTEGCKNRENKSKLIKERGLLGTKESMLSRENQETRKESTMKTGNFDLF